MDLILPFRVNSSLDRPTVLKTDTEYMTPETLYVNQTSSLNMGSPVICHHPSPRHQNDDVHTMLSVDLDKGMCNLMSWRY